MTHFWRFSTVLLAIVAITLGACSGDRAAESDGAGGKLRVALLTPGPISDRSWNGGAYEGLIRIRDSLGAEVSHIQTRTPAEFEENFRQYGVQGFNIVFGHGFEFQDAAARVAPNYPRTIYVTTSGTRTGRNVAGVNFAFEEPSYIAGMIAGRMTKTNKLGMIGGTELPPVKRSFSAFEQGAKQVNPQVQVIISYIGNWDDVSAGKEQAIAQISRGVDIIFQNADAAGLGIFQAVKEASGVRIIGSNANQNDIAPLHTLGSVVIDLPRALMLITREAQKPGFTGKVFLLGLHDGVVKFITNPQLANIIPDVLRAEVRATEQAMRNGSFRSPLLADSLSAPEQE
ncbi:MAG: BMP family protein [Gemmatimonadaceae bacterium]|nr:BMP family protein [Gemmatimonadaceae bacterium]